VRWTRRILLVLGALLVALVLVVGLATALDRPATRVHQEFVVHAPRPEVWRLLTNLEGYHAWNPYITWASGEVRGGARIKLQLDPEHGDPYRVPCDVLIVKQMRKVFWRCRTRLPGVLDREHTFRLLPIDADSMRLVYEGRWEGVLVPFTDLDDRKQGYRRMVLALKNRAEQSG
jgi:hypothetical protein